MSAGCPEEDNSLHIMATPSETSENGLVQGIDNATQKVKASSTPQSVTPTATAPLAISGPSPKKSARLAEKRKLREEAGSSALDEEFYFKAYKSCRLSSPVTIRHESNSKTTTVLVRDKSSNTFTPISEPLPPENSSNSVLISETSSTKDMPEPSVIATQEAEASSEEEKWFDALDVGKLDDINIEDLSTSVKLFSEEGSSKSFDIGLENGTAVENPKLTSTTTKDMVKSRMEKCERRKILARQKKEHDKKRTVDRLLKKSQSKFPKASNKKHGPKSTEPMLTYVIGKEVNTISFPGGLDESLFGYAKKSEVKQRRSLDPVLCGVDGCVQPKKYTCSKTEIPICSLECYKKNLRLRTDNFSAETERIDSENILN